MNYYELRYPNFIDPCLIASAHAPVFVGLIHLLIITFLLTVRLFWNLFVLGNETFLILFFEITLSL